MPGAAARPAGSGVGGACHAAGPPQVGGGGRGGRGDGAVALGRQGCCHRAGGRAAWGSISPMSFAAALYGMFVKAASCLPMC